ncbi:MAG: Mg-chelatase subunit ChlD [Planctomycetota bacterium]|jgi:Mg-chelatase subunit ChlD
MGSPILKSVLRTPHASLWGVWLVLVSWGTSATGLAARAPQIPAPVVEQPSSPTQDLAAWWERFGRSERWWPTAREELRELLDGVEREAQSSPDALRAAGDVLLDLAALEIDSMPKRSFFRGGSNSQRTRQGAFNLLRKLLDSEVRERLGRQLSETLVIAGSSSSTRNDLGRRYVAAFLCSMHREDSGRMALLLVARNQADPMRPAALTLLGDWPGDDVDLFLVRLLGRKFDSRAKPHPFNLLLERVRSQEQPLGTRASIELVQRMRLMLLSTDWREVARAVELSVGLKTERRVPLLIDSLSAWQRRMKMGTGSKRVIDDIVRALRGISGRSAGTNPHNWITWWMAVRAGKTPLHAKPTGDRQVTSSGFFGLRPVTDKVTFIIDISGSMQATWLTDTHSRYVEAVEQMMVFLQGMGERGQFNVILFNDQPLRSTPQLVKARATTLEQARQSLLSREPGGGTNLRSAVELALRLDSKGRVDPERLTADTFVVLCDGETQSGSRWVKPLFDRIQADAQLRIHTVLIGTQGDGTLEALSKATGGDFVRID